MDPLIQSLVRFQELNLEISRLDARLSQIPIELKAVDSEQQAAAASVARVKGGIVEEAKRRRDHERELQDLEGKISKYNDQSRDVKTNEQYRAIMSEIQNVRTHIGQVEEKILLAMEAIDTLERQVREEEKSVAARKGEFDSRRGVLASERARVTGERDRLKAEAEIAAKDVPPDAMDVYGRMARLRGGVAMARARDERCMACNVRLRPQVFADVRKNNQIIQCESCKRILYYIEEAPPPGAAPEGPRPEPGAAADGAPGAQPEPA